MTFAPADWKTFRDRENPPALLESSSIRIRTPFGGIGSSFFITRSFAIMNFPSVGRETATSFQAIG